MEGFLTQWRGNGDLQMGRGMMDWGYSGHLISSERI